jgi:hypothetical protein
MARRKSIVAVIRGLVQEEIGSAINSLLGTGKAKRKNGRRRKRRGKWRPGGPGRPPKAIAEKAAQPKKVAKGRRRRRRRRGPGRPPGSKKKAA